MTPWEVAQAILTAREYVYGHTSQEVPSPESEEVTAMWALDKVAEVVGREIAARRPRLDYDKFLQVAGFER